MKRTIRHVAGHVRGGSIVRGHVRETADLPAGYDSGYTAGAMGAMPNTGVGTPSPAPPDSGPDFTPGDPPAAW